MVKYWNYGHYSSENYGAHTLAFRDVDGNEFYFSYRTLVAFRRNNGNLYVRQNVWGATTGKHLNWIDGGDKKNRLSEEDFNRQFKNIFGTRELNLSA